MSSDDNSNYRSLFMSINKTSKHPCLTVPTVSPNSHTVVLSSTLPLWPNIFLVM